MKLDDDDFTLLGLPQRFAQDRALVDTRWRELQGQVHPDRFAAEGAAAQRIAMQWAVRVNEAYQRIKDPLKRAAYLCELNGAPINSSRVHPVNASICLLTSVMIPRGSVVISASMLLSRSERV